MKKGRHGGMFCVCVARWPAAMLANHGVLVMVVATRHNQVQEDTAC